MIAGCLWLIASTAGSPQADRPGASPEDAIVVTGERSDRSLRRTASSVAIISGERIERSGSDRLDDILAQVPNVQLGNGSQAPAIRGQDTTGPLSSLPAFLGGNRPRTSLVVDGRPVSYNELVFGAFPVWDVDRIEVFRSPQSTTQGQNSIAGAIFIDTNDPSENFEFRARGIVGDYATRQISGVVSGPIAGDSVAFRLAGDWRRSRVTSTIAPLMNGADPNRDLFGIVRAKLRISPTPSTKATITYAHSLSQAPQTIGLSPPFERRRDDNPNYGVFRVRVDSLTAALHQALARDITADFTLSGGRSHAQRFAIRGFGETINKGRDRSAEAILRWTPDGGPIRLLAGIADSRLHLDQSINLSLLSGAIGRFSDTQDGMGLFGEASFTLSPITTLTTGLRYQRDRQRRVGALTATGFVVPVDFDQSFSALLPKIALSHDVTPSLTIGALVQKAYNPGGTTIRIDTSRPENFRAESLWDFEGFVRAGRTGSALSGRINAFYYAMRDAQRSQPIIIAAPNGRPVGFARLFNVPRARTMGAEGEIEWRPGDALDLRASLGLLATRILSSPAEAPSLAGKNFERSPHLSAAVAADWRPAPHLLLSVAGRMHSAYFSDPENRPTSRVPPGASIDLRAQYDVGRMTLFAQVRNATDAFNLTYVVGNFGEAEDPRMVAAGIEASF